MAIVYRFTCGHVGRTNESDSPRRKVSSFIRVAELRGAIVQEADKPCPDCKK